MFDIFTDSRGRLLFEDTDLYGKLFSEARSKTAEHSICVRSKIYPDEKNEKIQKIKKNEEI